MNTDYEQSHWKSRGFVVSEANKLPRERLNLRRSVQLEKTEKTRSRMAQRAASSVFVEDPRNLGAAREAQRGGGR